MANIRKWIAEARDLEEAGDLQGALSVFRKALVVQEETSGFADLSLYNGLGDLYLRAGDVHEAVEAYENAATQCEEQQLYANAIALCKKILRNAPEHAPVYRRVGRLFALSGLDAESSANYQEYVRRLREDGRPSEALDALREMIELTADEGAAIDVADELVDEGRADDALRMLRATKERREKQGRDIVVLIRKIQELQPLCSEEARQGAASPPAPTVRSSGGESIRAGAPNDEPGDNTAAASTEREAVSTTPTPADATATPHDPSYDDADMGSLTRELQRVLAECQGDDRFRHALPILDHLLEVQPGRFELLHRKLAYAFALGEEDAAVSAYLALGECLDRELDRFTLRTLSTSTPSGAVTAAVKAEASELAPGS